MRRASLYYFFLAAALCALGCDRDKGKQAQDMLDSLVTSSERVLSGAGNLSSEDALKEVRKLRQWEYQVISLPIETKPALIEARLDAEGMERWECFSVERTRDPETEKLNWLIICRRHPDTPLVYVPSQILGR
jgi:hypothetical protein